MRSCQASGPSAAILVAMRRSDMGGGLSRGQGEAAGRNRRYGPPLRMAGCVHLWVSSVSVDAFVSLICAGWLPQDGTFESELAAV